MEVYKRPFSYSFQLASSVLGKLQKCTLQVKKLINHLGFWDKARINALLRELPILIAAAEDINPDVDRSQLIFSEGRSDAAYIRYLSKDWKSVLLFLIVCVKIGFINNTNGLMMSLS